MICQFFPDYHLKDLVVLYMSVKYKFVEASFFYLTRGVQILRDLHINSKATDFP